jgi:hypothetical protein
MEVLSTVLVYLMVISFFITLGLLVIEILTKGPKERRFTYVYVFAAVAVISLITFLILVNLFIY